MKLNSTLAVLLFSALLSGAASASENDCMKSFLGVKNYPHTTINISKPKTKLSVKNDTSRRALTQIATGQVHVGDQYQLNGLTVATMESTVGANLIVISRPDGSSCVWPSQVDLSVGYDSMDVYVVSEYSPSTCPHSVTLQHELEHVRINRDSLNSHLPRIGKSLERKIKMDYPRRVPTGMTPSDYVVRDLSAHLDKYVSQMTSERDAKHQHLDSPRSYAYWQSLCDRW